MEYDLKNDEQKEEVYNVVRFTINKSMLEANIQIILFLLLELCMMIGKVFLIEVWEHILSMRHFHAFLERYSNDDFNKGIKDDKDDYLKKKKTQALKKVLFFFLVYYFI